MKTVRNTLILLLGITGSALFSTQVLATDNTSAKEMKIVCIKAPCPGDIKPPVIKPPRPEFPGCKYQPDGREICKKPGIDPPQPPVIKPPVIKPPHPGNPGCKHQPDGRKICVNPGITPPKPPANRPPLIHPVKHCKLDASGQEICAVE